MKASIITIGDEILIGQTIDTNSAWLSQQLRPIGFEIVEIISVSDKKETIESGLVRALSIADLVIITGGLGPTQDDITKKTLADFLGHELVPNAEALEGIEAYYKNRKLPIPESAQRIALFPLGADLLTNKRGTASGIWFNHRGKIIISLPGVPGEMKQIMADYGIPKLIHHYQLKPLPYLVIQTSGIGETAIEEKIKDIVHNFPAHISIAYLPSLGCVKLRITSSISNSEKEIDLIGKEIIQKLHKYFYAIGEVKLEEYILDLFTRKKMSLSTAESCTGGAISAKLVSVSGSSAYFEGGVVSYSYEAKSHLLNLDKSLLQERGAVSEEVVKIMATEIMKNLNTDYALAVSGIAGPNGGTLDKAVGTVWIATASKKEVIAKMYNFGNNRADNIERSAVAALTQLRWMVENQH